MRFGKKFVRRVGGTTSDPVLGSDSPPAGIPASGDNQFDWKVSNVHGFPIQRLVVGYAGPGGAAALVATLYVWDDLSLNWFKSEAVTVQPGALTWFDCPTLGDSSNGTSAGAINVALVVAAAGGDPAGLYTFSLGADLSAGNSNSSGSSSAGSATAANQVTGNASLGSIDGKVSAAAAGADAESNATTMGSLRSRIMSFGGTTWDRVRSGLTAVTSTLTGYLNVLPFAVFNTAPATRTTGQGGPLEADATGNLRTAEQYAFGFNNTNITGTATTVVKSGAGVLKSIIVNKAVATGTISVFDNTAGSGTLVATITTPTGPTGPYVLPYEYGFTTGMTIVTAVAAQDITAVWA